MNAVPALYRLMTAAVGAVACPIGRALSPGGSPRRGLWGAVDGIGAVAGGPWIHAASMGEAAAARSWGRALVADGYRAPFLVTTRTRAGLERVRRDWGNEAMAALAPLDFPQGVRRVLEAAAPMRLDLMETELWPQLLLQAHRAGLPVVVVSATVSARTASRLRALGFAGAALFGPLHVLAQSDRHAGRYRDLGVAPERCRVIGDVKADARGGVRDAPLPEYGARRLVLFASARPGEEAAIVAMARALAARSDAGRWHLVVAPRHDRGAQRAEAALAAAGFEVDRRAQPSEPLREWAARSGRGSAPRVALLATRGELPDLFPLARLAFVGGTFAPYGGHNVLEPASFGCPVLVGPHHDDVEAGVALLRAHGGGGVVAGAAAAASALGEWLDDPTDARSRGALDAAAAARGASRRGLDALEAWGLVP